MTSLHRRLQLFVLTSLSFSYSHAFNIAPSIVRNGASLSEHGPIVCKENLAGRASLRMADDSASPSSDDMQAKLDGRKRRVISGYYASSVAYLAIAAGMLARGGLGIVTLQVVSGPFVAGCLAYILEGAAENNRLGSDTYKRLNLVLALYGLVGTVVLLGNPLLVLPNLVTLVNAVKGYGYGCLGWELEKPKLDAVKEGFSIAKSWPKVLFPNIFSSIASTIYAAATTTVLTWKLHKLYEIAQMVFGNGTSAIPMYEVAIRLVRYARLTLLTVIAFSLKDAADRDRLQGTTFIQLNGVGAVGYGIQAAHLLTQTSCKPLGWAMTAFSAFFAYQGITSYRAKKAAA